MPRTERIWYPGGVYHLICRCTNREYLFDGPEERRRYLSLLSHALSRTDAELLAWCLMSNHNHLAVRAGEEPLGRLMKRVNSGYAIWKNRKDGRLGPVFAHRYEAILVEDEWYLLELVRYMHNNVVRAGLVRHARESWWSSHNYYLGRIDQPSWLNTDIVLGRFSSNSAQARVLFDQFVDDGALESKRLDLSGGRTADARKAAAERLGDCWRITTPIVGSEMFSQKVLRENRVQVLNRTLPLGKEPDLFLLPLFHRAACHVLGLGMDLSRAIPGSAASVRVRALLTYVWVVEFGGRQTQVGRYFKVRSSTVSKWLGRALDRPEEIQPHVESAKIIILEEMSRCAHGAGDLASYRIMLPLATNG